ncbi:MAG: hypothetical protein AMXMBFR20_31230 [Planctomycetia bacterium]|jgi:ABC-type sugar transport system substrate-binding protein|nr:substrate-binding domain-containing protein [Planctomycetota bacterium]OQZ05348.1 MAG: hypothetical protein B6D36_10585 [Planctomycetes bacterium UTPLA1]
MNRSHCIIGTIRRARHWSRIAWLIALCAVGAGCDENSGESRSRIEPTRILFVGEGKDVASWRVIEATTKAFGEAHPHVTVEAVAPPISSPVGQKNILVSLADHDVDAICVIPIQPDALGAIVSEIANGGIPVVVVGRDIIGSRRSAYCGPSESELGEKTVTACGMVLEKRSKTLMLLHAAGANERQGFRYRGFQHELPMAGGVHVVREVDCGGDPAEAVRLAKSESRKYPRIGCWALLDDWPLRSLPPHERLFGLGITMVVCDADPSLWPRMEDGQIQAMVGYDLREAIRAGLTIALRLTMPDDRRFVTDVHIKAEVFTEANLAQLKARWALWEQGKRSPQE